MRFIQNQHTRWIKIPQPLPQAHRIVFIPQQRMGNNKPIMQVPRINPIAAFPPFRCHKIAIVNRKD